MQYSLNKITTVSACNALLAKAQETKQALERKRRNLGEAIDAFRERMDRMAREKAEVQALLSAFTTCYQALPEGKYKLDMNIKVKRLELRQARLDMKALTYNVRALLVKQMKYNMLDQKVLAIHFYITALQNHLAALVATPEGVSQEVAVLRLPVVRRELSGAEDVYTFKRRFLKVTDGAEPDRGDDPVHEGDQDAGRTSMNRRILGGW